MKIVLGPGCDKGWRDSLSPWQRKTLAALFRQGKGLPDRTNHGSDERWAQAGCKTRSSYGTWHRNPRSSGHERALILRTDYGYDLLLLRRTTGVGINPDTGETTEVQTVWVCVGHWYVSHNSTANFHPDSETARRWRRPRAGAACVAPAPVAPPSSHAGASASNLR